MPNQMTVNVNLSLNLEFLKLARSMRDAQKEGQHSQKAQRRAKSLEQLFDAKLETLEKEAAKLQAMAAKQPPLPLISGDSHAD